jgi:hypothetical protein
MRILALTKVSEWSKAGFMAIRSADRLFCDLATSDRLLEPRTCLSLTTPQKMKRL